MIISLIDKLLSLLLYQGIVTWLSDISLAGFVPRYTCTLLSTQNGRLLLRLRDATPYA